MLQELSLQQLIEIASENYLEHIEYNENYDEDIVQETLEEEVVERVKAQVKVYEKKK